LQIVTFYVLYIFIYDYVLK